MPRKRSISRKKKKSPSKQQQPPDDADSSPEEEEEERDKAVISTKPNSSLSSEEKDEDNNNTNLTTARKSSSPPHKDDNHDAPLNLLVLDPNDHDLSSSSGDEGKEQDDEINHPTTNLGSLLTRRRTSTTINNNDNNNRQSSTTSPSSPSITNNLQSSSSPSSSPNNNNNIDNNNTTTTESEGNQNSQDVLTGKTRTITRRKSPQSATITPATTTTKLSPKKPSTPTSSSTTNVDNNQSSSDGSNNKMEDDDAFLRANNNNNKPSSPNEKDDDSDEVVYETPKKSRTKRRPPTATRTSSTTTPKGSPAAEEVVVPKSSSLESSTTTIGSSEASSSSLTTNNEKDDMDTTTDNDNTEDSGTTTTILTTPTRSRKKNSVKRKADVETSSSESDDDDEESSKSQQPSTKQRKLDSRPQRRRGGGGVETTPISSSKSTSTPQPSPGLSRPRKLDVSKRLLILRGSDLKSLASLKKKVASAINESKKNTNRASPKRPDTDVSRLSGNLTELDLKLLTDESISTGTVTLIDGTSQSNKRSFKDVEEYDEFKEFKDGTMVHIPIPNVRIIEEEPAGALFTRTSKYIKYEDPDRYDRSTLTLNPVPPQAEFDTYSHRNIDISVEYNIESEDEEWLNSYNKESRYPLSEKDFESIIALMNRASKNGKSCWFSVSSVIELSRFFDVKFEERHIVHVKRLWESKYNAERKLFKDVEFQKRIENENLLYEYMCVRQQLNAYKENVEQVMEISNQGKDLLEKHLKQMKRKNYSVSKDFPKFVTKYSSATTVAYDDIVDPITTTSTTSETDENNSSKSSEEYDHAAFIADQVEMDLFRKEENNEGESSPIMSNQKARKSWTHKQDNCSPNISTPSSLASLIIPPIATKNLCNNSQTPESKTPIDTPTSSNFNSEDQHSSKRRTRKKRVDSGTPTSNSVSQTPTSASNLDFQQAFELPSSNNSESSSISSPTPDIVPPLLEATSPIPSPGMRRKKKRSKIIIN